MNTAPVVTNEQDDLKNHNDYYNLEEFPEVHIEDICHLAAVICNTPLSMVAIVTADDKWLRPFKNAEHTKVPGGFPFYCDDTAGHDGIFTIPDLSTDKRFSSHPYVVGAPHAIFYTAVRIVNTESVALATLCILDTHTHKLKAEQFQALKALVRQAAAAIELNAKTAQLKKKQAELKMAYADLAKIAHIASHDLKSPLNNIISLTHLLKDDYGTKFDPEGNEYINFLNEAAYQLSDMVSGILSYSRSSQLLVEQKETIEIATLIEEVKSLLNVPARATIKYPHGHIYTSRIALKQILLHLFHNAIKYNSKEKIKIDVLFNESADGYRFEVSDNGPGIDKADKEKIFELFEKLNTKIKDGESMGIGLAIVKRLVEKLGGTIKVESELDKGASFQFTIPK